MQAKTKKELDNTHIEKSSDELLENQIEILADLISNYIISLNN